MSRKTSRTVNIQATIAATANVSSMPTPEQIADATMSRLKAEILNQFDSVKEFAEKLSTISYYGLNDNLKGKSDMKLSVLYECLSVLGMDQLEFTRRVMQDATSPR